MQDFHFVIFTVGVTAAATKEEEGSRNTCYSAGTVIIILKYFYCCLGDLQVVQMMTDRHGRLTDCVCEEIEIQFMVPAVLDYWVCELISERVAYR